MLFRFVMAVLLLILVCLSGIALERANLDRRRLITLQRYRLDQLEDQRSRLRLEISRLSSPARLSSLSEGSSSPAGQGQSQ